MEIKSLSYLAFALIFILVYFALAKVPKGQKYALLAGNLIFFLSVSDLRSLCMVALECTVTFCLALRIEKKVTTKDKIGAAHLAHIGVGVLIIILCYFKFFRSTFAVVQSFFGNFGVSLTPLLMPLGISYYTLSMIAYLLDVSHKKHPAEKSFLTFFVFITFFPSIVEGPVNLYRKVAPQYEKSHYPQEIRIVKGAMRTLWGYVKKVVIADRIGSIVVAAISDGSAPSAAILWSMVLYSFQIYADFSGGIDVIMGITEILDIQLSENFRSPLVSRSVTEYWARWHMSLGEFMEKYLYYPLVLNRKIMTFSKKIPNKYLQKVFSASLASLLVFIVVGIWHGTGWNYVVYGCYQALFVASAVLLAPVYKQMRAKLRIPEKSLWWHIFQSVRTFCILVVGRFFIRAANLTKALSLLQCAFNRLSLRSLAMVPFNGLHSYGMGKRVSLLIYTGIAAMIAVDILHERGVRFRDWILGRCFPVRCAIYLAALFLIIIFGTYGPGVDTSGFIYAAY